MNTNVIPCSRPEKKLTNCTLKPGNVPCCREPALQPAFFSLFLAPNLIFVSPLHHHACSHNHPWCLLHAVLLTSLVAHATAQSPGCCSYTTAPVPGSLLPGLAGYPIFVICWTIGILAEGQAEHSAACTHDAQIQWPTTSEGHLSSGLLTGEILRLQLKLPNHPTYPLPPVLPYSFLLPQYATALYKFFFASELQQLLVRGLEGS